MTGMVAKQCRVLFLLPTLKGNISALLMLSDSEQAHSREFFFFYTPIRNFQHHDISMTIDFWCTGYGTKSP